MNNINEQTRDSIRAWSLKNDSSASQDYIRISNEYVAVDRIIQPSAKTNSEILIEALIAVAQITPNRRIIYIKRQNNDNGTFCVASVPCNSVNFWRVKEIIKFSKASRTIELSNRDYATAMAQS